jgi:uncharacterized protein (DUF885 family)
MPGCLAISRRAPEVTGRPEEGRDSARIRRFFEEAFEERVSRSPETLAALGDRRRGHELDDRSEAGMAADIGLVQEQLRRLRGLAATARSTADRLNCRIFEREGIRTLERYRYRWQEYPVNQKFGLHVEFPAFMINLHQIERVEDARAYISRLHALDRSMRQVIAGLEQRAARGVVLPKYLYPEVIRDCRDVIRPPRSGDGPAPNVLMADFQAKLGKLPGVGERERARLVKRAQEALRVAVTPAYLRLIACLERQRRGAPEEAGAWHLPDGDAYYRMCLERHTTTDLSAVRIHALGLAEVARIRQQILVLKDAMGFAGGLGAFYAHARENPDFYYPQSPDGRQDYLDEMNRLIAGVAQLLPTVFNLLPQDELLVKAVERHRERTAGIAFYNGPAADGSRPGIFYVNLYDLRQLPKFTMEALAYHEALPGHHLQFSIANRLRNLPRFRRLADYTAYVEGWGLYSELLAKELGLYRTPYAEFGRLVQELKRACRLVVDSGIHALRWTRRQAIGYLQAQLPASLPQIVKEVERYVVFPGQATSYTVGMARILRIRKRACAMLGEKYSLAEFHDELLRHGPLPLDLLEEQIIKWGRR